jgi:hypothetical protein
MKTKTKTFDAVEMKRRGAERSHEQTKDMTPEEQLAFWRQRTEALRKRQQVAQEKHTPS